MTSHAEQVGCDSRTRLCLCIASGGRSTPKSPAWASVGQGLGSYSPTCLHLWRAPPAHLSSAWASGSSTPTFPSPPPRLQAPAGASLGPRGALRQRHLVQPWQDRRPMQTDLGSRQPAPGLQPEDPAFLLPPGQKVREAQRADCWRGAISKPRTEASGGSRPGSTRTTEFHGATDCGATGFRGLSQAVQAVASCYGGPCDFQ